MSTSTKSLTAAPAARGTECAGAARTRSRCSRSSRSPTTGTRASPASGGATSTASSTAARRRRSTRGACGTSPCRSTSRRCAKARRMLVGRHDFTTFRSAQCQSDSPVKTLDRLDVEPRRRGNPRRGGGAQLPPPPGALDGRLPGAGRARAVAAGRHAARRSKRATAPRSASTRRRTGLYFVEAIYP